MTGMMFGLGVAAGAAMFGGWHWGYSGGGWGNSYTTVNVNRATSISANNFNANRYRNGQWNARSGASRRRALSHAGGAAGVRPASARIAQQREQFRGQLDGRGNYTQRPGENRPAENRPAENRGIENRAGAAREPRRLRSTSTVAAAAPAATSTAAASPGATAAGVAAVATVSAAAVATGSGEDGDERLDVPARPPGPCRVRRAGRRRGRPAGRAASGKASGLPDRRSGGRAFTDAVRKGDPKALGSAARAASGASSCPTTSEQRPGAPHGLSCRLGRRPRGQGLGRQGDDRWPARPAGRCRSRS